jgi:hypothetical protein
MTQPKCSKNQNRKEEEKRKAVIVIPLKFVWIKRRFQEPSNGCRERKLEKEMQSILFKLIRESRELLGQNVTLTSGRTVFQRNVEEELVG